MPGLVLQALPRHGWARRGVGFTVTKKVGNAVIRNRTRRRLKEAARLLLRAAPVAGVDLVVIGRDATRGPAVPQLIDDLRRALTRRGRGVSPAAAVLVAGRVIAYQWTLRPVIGANCRFHPGAATMPWRRCAPMARCAAAARGPAHPALQSLERGRASTRCPVPNPRADGSAWTRNASSSRLRSPSRSCWGSSSCCPRRPAAGQPGDAAA